MAKKKYMVRNLRTGRWNRTTKKDYLELRKAGYKRGFTKIKKK